MYSRIFGGEPVYIYIVRKDKVLIKLARHRWNPFVDDDTMYIRYKKTNIPLDKNNECGPLEPYGLKNRLKPIIHSQQTASIRDRWMYVRKTLHVEHILKNSN
jgi:hypothetical protein